MNKSASPYTLKHKCKTHTIHTQEQFRDVEGGRNSEILQKDHTDTGRTHRQHPELRIEP